MKKLLLSAVCLSLGYSSFASIPAVKTLAPVKPGENISLNKDGLKKLSGAAKITPTPETQWGEWAEAGVSTVEFPDEEFIYTGTAENVPTFVRQDLNDESHLQYRFDGVLPTNTAAEVEAAPLYADVYGNEVTVYSQQLPTIDLGEFYNQYYSGPFAICDYAVLYDMEADRSINLFTKEPLNMKLNLCIYDIPQGEFEGIVSSGIVYIKQEGQAPFTIPSSCVIGGDMGMGLLKVEASEKVWSISYAIVKGDGNTYNFETSEFDNVVDRIINKDPELMTMMWMAGDIMATPMEGPGRYTLAAVAYDENEEVLSSATCAVYNMPNESWNWTSLGNAKVQEDLLREVFTMNLSNAGIEHNGPAEYEVAIEESKSTPGLYRLVNLYGPSHPYAAIFEYLNEFPVYTYIDCTNPKGCYIYNMPTGFIVKDDKSGEIKIGCSPSISFEEGFPYDMIFEEAPETFGTLEGGIITFTPDQYCVSVPVYQEFLGYDWFPCNMLTSNDFTVTLPGGSGVKAADTAAEAEYFNLQGERVANPTNGVFIKRQGDKVEKIIR